LERGLELNEKNIKAKYMKKVKWKFFTACSDFWA
jgi:hypothetical protein